MSLLDAKIAEATLALQQAETAAEKRKAKERREDLMRLKRVEQIYVWFHAVDDCFTSPSLLELRPACAIGVGPGSAQTFACDSVCYPKHASTSVLDVFSISTGRRIT